LDFVAAYIATEVDLRLTTDRLEGLLAFDTARGWIAVTLSRDQLIELIELISGELNRKPPRPVN
jgi:hypothetical protein